MKNILQNLLSKLLVFLPKEQLFSVSFNSKPFQYWKFCHQKPERNLDSHWLTRKIRSTEKRLKLKRQEKNIESQWLMTGSRPLLSKKFTSSEGIASRHTIRPNTQLFCQYPGTYMHASPILNYQIYPCEELDKYIISSFKEFVISSRICKKQLSTSSQQKYRKFWQMIHISVF